jgi:hypothetical protein
MLLAACGGRVSEPEDGGSSLAQASGDGPQGTPAGQPAPADAGFQVCPAAPPTIGVSCDLAPNSGCAYLGFQGACESFVCVGKRWKSANGDGC